MKEYVVGFCFGSEILKGTVVLLRKNKPEWQKGLLNGPGGLIEKDEPPLAAMVREFYEEVGVLTDNGEWTRFCEMEVKNVDGEKVKVYFFTMRSDEAIREAADLVVHEGEELILDAWCNLIWGKGVVPNLRWLLPMAANYEQDRVDVWKIQGDCSQQWNSGDLITSMMNQHIGA